MKDDVKIPPHDVNAEGAVLSAMLLEDWAVARGIELIQEEYFYKPAHKFIFRAICSIFEQGKEIDLITIINELKRQGNFEKVGGTAYLTEIQDVVSSAASIESHATIVTEKAVLRKLISTAKEIEVQCYDSSNESKAIIEDAEKKIFDVTENLASTGFRSITQTLPKTLRHMDEVVKRKTMIIGVPSGFRELDRMTGGFIKGYYYVIAARPSIGKTAFAINIAYNAVVKSRKKAGFFSLEMAEDAINLRMLAVGSGVSMFKMLCGFGMQQADTLIISKTADSLSDVSFHVDDTANTNMMDVRSKARRLKYEHGIDMIFIDYMQLLLPNVIKQSRQAEITEISRALKALAKELGIPIIVISQLSRGPETRQDKHPMLADLRESGAIEQDADVVMLLYRDEYYNKEESKEPGIADVDIAKNRNGPTGRIKLKWLRESMRFEGL